MAILAFDVRNLSRVMCFFQLVSLRQRLSSLLTLPRGGDCTVFSGIALARSTLPSTSPGGMVRTAIAASHRSVVVSCGHAV